jgi:hypothetical protein
MRAMSGGAPGAMSGEAPCPDRWERRWRELEDWLVATTLGRPRGGEQEYGIIVRQLVLDRMAILEKDEEDTHGGLGSDVAV